MDLERILPQQLLVVFKTIVFIDLYLKDINMFFIVFSFYLNHFFTYNIQRLFIYSGVVGKSN